MRDQRAEKLADILVDYSLNIGEGDLVRIRGAYHVEPLIAALYQRVLERGANPVVRATIPSLEPIYYRYANDDQLAYIVEADRWLWDHIDVDIAIIGEANTRQLSRIDPARQVIHTRARKPIIETFFNRAANKEVRWNVTLFPTEAMAMEAQMSLDEYEDFYYGACMVDHEDPVAEWQKISARGKELVSWVTPRKEVHIEGEGTDLFLGIEGRTWEASAGEENFPDGEFFTGPEETKTRGHVTFSYPAIYGGVAVEGARLEFEGGRVVNATARQNEEYLRKKLETDPGASVLGELGIGINYGVDRFTGEILLDEKIGGTVHLALGASYPETGGVNESAIHWDMVCDLRKGGRITVDGDVLMEDGKFVV